MDKPSQLVLYTLLFMSTVSSESLTFLGDSMAIYPKWPAREKGTLNFHFKTAEPNGQLLYMDDKDKSSARHLMLALEIGRLKLAISHSRVENIAEELGRDLHDSNWHNVTITRNHRTTLFELDGMQRIVAKLHWKGILEISSDLYVGNKPKHLISGTEGFIGCIKNLRYSEGYNEPYMHQLIEGIKTQDGCFNYCDKDMTKPRCNTGTCLNKFKNYKCDCFGTGYEGDYCAQKSPIISLRSNMDFLSKSSSSIQNIRSNKIQVRFKTTQKDGILLTIGKANDFFTLELYDGYIRAETNVGGGKVVLGSNRRLHDGFWHDVKISQNGPDFHLIVDSKSVYRFEQKMSSPYGNVDVTCNDQDIAYFGGHFNPITVIGSKSKQGFVGCLQQFSFNDINLIEDALIAWDTIQRNNRSQTEPRVDGIIDKGCTVEPRAINDVKTPSKTRHPTKRPGNRKTMNRPSVVNTGNGGDGSQASSVRQNPQSGERNATKLKKSSVAWITAGLVIGALVIILVMAFLIHRFRRKYRGTFMAPRDENGMPYYSSVQATYHIQNGIGKRQGRSSATDV